MVKDRNKGGSKFMAENRPVSGDQGQTAPDPGGAPQAEKEANRPDVPPARAVDASDESAAFRSAQVWTVGANPGVEGGDKFNEFQKSVNEPEKEDN